MTTAKETHGHPDYERRCRKCKRTQDELIEAGVDWDLTAFAECGECDPEGISS